MADILQLYYTIEENGKFLFSFQKSSTSAFMRYNLSDINVEKYNFNIGTNGANVNALHARPRTVSLGI